MHPVWHSFMFSSSLHSHVISHVISQLPFQRGVINERAIWSNVFFLCTPSITSLRKKIEREMIHFPYMLNATAKDPYPQFEHTDNCLLHQTRNFGNTCELKAHKLLGPLTLALLMLIIHYVPGLLGIWIRSHTHTHTHTYIYIYISGGPLSALTCCVNVRLLSAIKKISPLIYSQSWVGSWVYTTQAMMTFTLIF